VGWIKGKGSDSDPIPVGYDCLVLLGQCSLHHIVSRSHHITHVLRGARSKTIEELHSLFVIEASICGHANSDHRIVCQLVDRDEGNDRSHALILGDLESGSSETSKYS
jgi:hypothetical protein